MDSWISPADDLWAPQIQLVQNQTTGKGLGFESEKPEFISALHCYVDIGRVISNL